MNPPIIDQLSVSTGIQIEIFSHRKPWQAAFKIQQLCIIGAPSLYNRFINFPDLASNYVGKTIRCVDDCSKLLFCTQNTISLSSLIT